VDNLFSRIGQAVKSVKSLTNNAPVPYSSARSGSLFSTGDAVTSVADQAYQAYGSVGTLFAIVSQTGNAVASAEWHLYRRTSQRDKKRRKEVTSHAFLTVWNRPNPFYTGRLFRETVQQHLDLVGEGVIILNMVGSLVVEMWPVRPDRITPVKHPTKFLVGYVYHGPDGEEVPLEVNQVVHIKMPNPGDPYRGMGPVQTVLADMDAYRYSAQWNRNFFINGARPGGVIEVDYRMSEEEWKQFNMRWREQHQGVAAAHRVAVLENAKWKDTNFSMADMQFAELRDQPREIIREAFAFPKPMLGTVDDVNRANAEAGKTIMAENITEPRLARWKDVINYFLLPRFVNGTALEFDYDDPRPVDRELANAERDSQAKSTQLLTLAGYHPDDVTEAMGLPQMRWVGIPAKANETIQETPEQSDNPPPNVDTNNSVMAGMRKAQRLLLPEVDIDFDEE
jgi:HK97 family phage portal protein